MFRQVLTAVFSFAALCAVGQFYHLPQEFSFARKTERALARKDSSVHTGLQPFIPFFGDHYLHVPDTKRVFKYIKDDLGVDKIFNDHLIHIKAEEGAVRLRLDPLLNLEYGRDLVPSNRKRLYNNTRGFVGSGSIGKSFYFETMLAENQSFFPDWLSAYAKGTGVVPGQGRWKTFGEGGYDYAFASGMAAVRLSSHVNIQAGHGKHKVGHGYRSLVLSDNSFNYPYARISQQWLRGQIQYHNIYAVLTNLVPAAATKPANAERLFQKKPAAFQYLSMNPTRWLNLGLFQGIVWRAGDSKNVQHLGWEYLNPLIFGQAAAFGLNDRNNVLMGADAKLNLTHKIAVYGQVMMDGSGRNASDATGFQTGVSLQDALSIKNLFVQAEYNRVGDRSYINTSADTDQSWSHYGQSLAFVPGNGSEMMVSADFRPGRVFFSTRYHYQERSNGLNASQIVNLVNAHAGYVINPSYNLNISVGLLYRKQNFYNFISPFGAVNESSYLFLALRTNLYNLYYDF